MLTSLPVVVVLNPFLRVGRHLLRANSKLTFGLAARGRLWNSAGFFLLIWAVHYLPFFLMSRQLFIHHYLPSHLASALLAGSVLSFVLSDTVNYPISIVGRRTKMRKSEFADLGMKGPVVVGVFTFILFLMFLYMTPLTYGTPG